MLRMLFNEPPRVAEGQLLQTIQAMEQFSGLLRKQFGAAADASKDRGSQAVQRLRKFEVWTYGLMASLDELEQSQYAAVQFARSIHSATIKEMSPEERMSYYRHVYFDKNAFIRVFALLDKLGTLLNDVFELQTERIKPHFSYFTVLRTMRQRNKNQALTDQLVELKERYKEPVSRLRKRRNTEIHYMNSELEDDLRQSSQAFSSQLRLENLQAQMDDLEQGMQFVMKTLHLSFSAMAQQMRKRK
ncbi:Cthe_2314 family HEPN domain-containing protein [Paenibacillus sp. GCM10027626]|uniref:Cthe_2314 family HEPN domain-containing protein n=1 Tax=Paenibacillus sp. GCM10027626 TaxID=3273411 RepID=UPI00362FC456